MRRPLLVLAAALVLIGLVAGGLAWLLETPKPPPRADRAERLYYAFCVSCHGVDGRGSWRAALFLIRPGDIGDPVRLRGDSDEYVFEIIKHGGAPLGRPGMPGFGFYLSDEDVRSLIGYLRGLPGRRARR